MTGVFPFRDEAVTAARADQFLICELPSQPSSNVAERATAFRAADRKPRPFPRADLDDDRALAILAWLGGEPFGVREVLMDAPSANRVDHHSGTTWPVKSCRRPVNGLVFGKGTTAKFAVHPLRIAFGTKRATNL